MSVPRKAIDLFAAIGPTPISLETTYLYLWWSRNRYSRRLQFAMQSNVQRLVECHSFLNHSLEPEVCLDKIWTQDLDVFWGNAAI